MALTTKHNLPRCVRVLVATCCGLLIAGCGSLGSGGRSHVGTDPCNPGVCKAVVTVKNCVIEEIPTISVWSARNIEWLIDTDDQDAYSFPENGIVIEPPNGSSFERNPGVDKKGTKFTLRNKFTILSPPLIKYTIRVVRKSDGKKCDPYDPFISNDPS